MSSVSPKLHIDLAWMSRISVGLLKFKKVKTDVWNCRCPLCGDSSTNSKKARFFFYVKKGNLNTFCHKCNHSSSFYSFMKLQYVSQFDEYQKETLFDSMASKASKRTETLLDTTLGGDTSERLAKQRSRGISLDVFKKITTNILDLDPNHFARLTLTERAFSEEEMGRLYYTDNFMAVSSMLDRESSKKLKVEPRILIPFVDKDARVVMLQGRALTPGGLKYISIKCDESIEKLYGLYEQDLSKTTYCVEGPFDSLFVDNCVATCDSNLTRSTADVLVFDNEPRNAAIVKTIESAINDGRAVVIWPTSPNSKEDINDLVKRGITKQQIMKIIKENTYKGLTAKVKFMAWKRV